MIYELVRSVHANVSLAPDGTTAWTHDPPRFIALPALHVVACADLVSISAERPQGFLSSREPLVVVSADGAVGGFRRQAGDGKDG